jgi:midasin
MFIQSDTLQDTDNTDKDDTAKQDNDDGVGKFDYTTGHDEGTSQVLGGVSEEQYTAQQQQQQQEDDDTNDMSQQNDDQMDITAVDDSTNEQQQPDDTTTAANKDDDETGDVVDKNLKAGTKKSDTGKAADDNKQQDDNNDEANDSDTDDTSTKANGQLEEEWNPEHELQQDAVRGTSIVTSAPAHLSRKKAPATLQQQQQQPVLDPHEELIKVVQAWSQQPAGSVTVEQARSRWSRLRALTAPQAQRLCEQLRLVLEPLVATKLRGDYRAGKRINMRRVIGYIASGFRRDKIWLRRTRPAKRAYQVLLAIDDSESMVSCGAGNLALAAMAMMASGLTQLEVGQMAVARFGADMQLLHGFDDAFTEDSGARILSSFGFDQSATNTSTMLDQVQGFLETAAAMSTHGSANSSSNSSPQQLVFIISDGHCDREMRPALQRRMRDMSEKGQLVALIIIDKGGPESILGLNSVSFTPGQGVVQTRYLDGYPFPYYIVLRDLQALPEILADALRQWFELVQRQSDA